MHGGRPSEAAVHWSHAISQAAEKDMLHYRALAHYLLGGHARVQDRSLQYPVVNGHPLLPVRRAILCGHSLHRERFVTLPNERMINITPSLTLLLHYC